MKKAFFLIKRINDIQSNYYIKYDSLSEKDFKSNKKTSNNFI